MTAPRKQCGKCPWKVSVDPRNIPNGYCERKHRNLRSTIAEPGALGGVNTLHIMACHETHDTPCVGWLSHQLGPGNNIPLRLAAVRGSIDANIETDGEQHQTFQATLPTTIGRQDQ